MSILIKDMKMPMNCDECPLGEYEDSEWFSCSLMNMAYRHMAQCDRLDDCPLIEIKTPHGDLIDRNALKKDYRMGNDCERCETDWKSCQYDRVYSKMDFCEWIDDAPVVIEAEGE